MVHLIIRLLTIGTVTALVALLLYVGKPGEWWSLPMMLFACWIIGPTVTAYVFARLLKHRTWFPYVIAALLAGFAILSAFAYYDAFFVSESSTAALVLLMVPLFQWATLVVVGFACACAAIWLDRRAARE